MARGVSALDYTFSPLHTFSVRRRLIRMGFMSGRCWCCLLIILVSFVGIYFTYYVNPALKGDIGVLNPRKNAKDAKVEDASFRSDKLLSLGEGRDKIIEIARLKSKLRTPSLKKEQLEIQHDLVRNDNFRRSGDEDGLQNKDLQPKKPLGKKHFYVDLRGNIITDEPESHPDNMRRLQKPAIELKDTRAQPDPQDVPNDQGEAGVNDQREAGVNGQVEARVNDQVEARVGKKINQPIQGKYSVKEKNVRKPFTQPLVRVEGLIGNNRKAQGNVLNRLKEVPQRKSRVAVQDDQSLLQDNHETSMTGINRMVHLTWRSNKLPEIANDWVKQWPTTNAIMKVAFWDDASMNALVERHFQEFVPTWTRYSFPIDRVRAFQILVLYKLGGIYSDIDVVPLEPLKGVINMYPCVLAQENPVACAFYNKPRSENTPCVSMHIMACRANHPFLKLVIETLKSAALTLDCSAKPVQCTSHHILGEAFKEYKLDHRSHENQVQLVVPDYFSSTFDPAEKKTVQIACTDYTLLDNEQKRLCKILGDDGYKNKPSDSSYMLHKFLHTWGSRSNPNQEVIKDGPDSIYESIDNVIKGKTLI